MRLIDADKLHPDCMTKDGKLAICQSQLANAMTVKPCENCDLYYMVMTKEEMKKGGAENDR